MQILLSKILSGEPMQSLLHFLLVYAERICQVRNTIEVNSEIKLIYPQNLGAGNGILDWATALCQALNQEKSSYTRKWINLTSKITVFSPLWKKVFAANLRK